MSSSTGQVVRAKPNKQCPRERSRRAADTHRRSRRIQQKQESTQPSTNKQLNNLQDVHKNKTRHYTKTKTLCTKSVQHLQGVNSPVEQSENLNHYADTAICDQQQTPVLDHVNLDQIQLAEPNAHAMVRDRLNSETGQGLATQGIGGESPARCRQEQLSEEGSEANDELVQDTINQMIAQGDLNTNDSIPHSETHIQLETMNAETVGQISICDVSGLPLQTGHLLFHGATSQSSQLPCVSVASSPTETRTVLLPPEVSSSSVLLSPEVSSATELLPPEVSSASAHPPQHTGTKVGKSTSRRKQDLTVYEFKDSVMSLMEEVPEKTTQEEREDGDGENTDNSNLTVIHIEPFELNTPSETLNTSEVNVKVKPATKPNNPELLAPRILNKHKDDGEVEFVPVGRDLKVFLANHHLIKGLYLNRGKRQVKHNLVTLQRHNTAIDQGSWQRGKGCHARNRLDDMFVTSRLGKQKVKEILSKRTRDEYAVNWYLWCPGHGNCKRKCGGFGACIEGENHKYFNKNLSLDRPDSIDLLFS